MYLCRRIINVISREHAILKYGRNVGYKLMQDGRVFFIINLLKVFLIEGADKTTRPRTSERNYAHSGGQTAGVGF